MASMQNIAIPGALIGAGVGTTLTPDDPILGATGGALVGAGAGQLVEKRAPSLDKVMRKALQHSVPPLAAVLGGGALGRVLAPTDDRMTGMLLGAGIGGLGTAMLPKYRTAGMLLGLPALVAAGLRYLLNKAHKESPASYGGNIPRYW